MTSLRQNVAGCYRLDVNGTVVYCRNRQIIGCCIIDYLSSRHLIFCGRPPAVIISWLQLIHLIFWYSGLKIARGLLTTNCQLKLKNRFSSFEDITYEEIVLSGKDYISGQIFDVGKKNCRRVYMEVHDRFVEPITDLH